MKRNKSKRTFIGNKVTTITPQEYFDLKILKKMSRVVSGEIYGGLSPLENCSPDFMHCCKYSVKFVQTDLNIPMNHHLFPFNVLANSNSLTWHNLLKILIILLFIY